MQSRMDKYENKEQQNYERPNYMKKYMMIFIVIQLIKICKLLIPQKRLT